MPMNEKLYSHYFKEVPTNHIDVYRVLLAFGVTDPTIQHAIKKLLCTGVRGAKTVDQDVAEAIASLSRFQEMQSENTLYAISKVKAEPEVIDLLREVSSRRKPVVKTPEKKRGRK